MAEYGSRKAYMDDRAVLESIASFITGAVAEPVSGMGGILASTAGSDKGAQAVKNIQEAMTYQPRSQGGKDILQDLGRTLEPVAEGLEKGANYLGDKTLQATGSEELATLAHIVPNILMEALPAGMVMRQGARRANYPEVSSKGPGGKQKGMLKDPDWMKTKAQYETLPDKKPNQNIYIPVGDRKIEVMQNPSNSDVASMQKEAVKQYGRSDVGDSPLRFTDDALGNRYYWKAHEAVHEHIEPKLSEKVGEKLSQNEGSRPSHRNIVRRAMYNGENVPDNVIAEYPGIVEDVMSINGNKYKPKKQLTEFEEAHAIAQLNAALPPSEGGLGLPKNNTAMDRASAMGFENKDWYHGTTHDINKFLAAESPTANKEGYFGAGTYLTDSPLDASDNYAGMGPDLTNRVQSLKERYEQEFKSNPEEYDIFSDTDFAKAATERAHKELLGNNQGVIYPVMTRPKNKFDYDYGEVGYKEPELNIDDYMDDAKDEFDIGDYDGDKDAYNTDVEERAQEIAYEESYNQEPEGVIEDMHDTFRRADSYDDAGNEFQTALENHDINMDSGEVPAKDFIDNLRNSYISDAETGDNIASDITAQAIENAGFDAINMNADMAFGNQSDMARYGNEMNMDYDTQHQVLRDPSLIRSRFAAFDPKRKNSRDILAGLSSVGVSLPVLAKMLGQEEQTRDY